MKQAHHRDTETENWVERYSTNTICNLSFSVTIQYIFWPGWCSERTSSFTLHLTNDMTNFSSMGNQSLLLPLVVHNSLWNSYKRVLWEHSGLWYSLCSDILPPSSPLRSYCTVEFLKVTDRATIKDRITHVSIYVAMIWLFKLLKTTCMFNTCVSSHVNPSTDILGLPKSTVVMCSM